MRCHEGRTADGKIFPTEFNAGRYVLNIWPLFCVRKMKKGVRNETTSLMLVVLNLCICVWLFFVLVCLYGVVIFNTEDIGFICIKYIIIPSFTKSWLLWYFCCCCDDLRKVSFSETYFISLLS